MVYDEKCNKESTPRRKRTEEELNKTIKGKNPSSSKKTRSGKGTTPGREVGIYYLPLLLTM